MSVQATEGGVPLAQNLNIPTTSTAPAILNTYLPQYEAPQTNPSRVFTTEDIERARQQEKDKLYPRLNTMQEELDRIKAERDAAVAAEQERLTAADATRRAQEEAEMEVRELLRVKQEEWEQRFTQMQKDQELKEALLKRESELRELTEYRERRKLEVSDDIIPDLLDLVSGDTPDEIESSIARLVAKSNAIIEAAQGVNAATRAAQPSVRPTGAPAVGPLDTLSAPQSFSAEDIANMSMQDYVKNRSKLLGGQKATERGLFG